MTTYGTLWKASTPVERVCGDCEHAWTANMQVVQQFGLAAYVVYENPSDQFCPRCEKMS